MSVVTDTWNQLVRRKLWPVVLLLLLALVAVPVVLAKEPEPIAPAPVAPQSEATLAAAPADPIVALAGAEDRAKRRRVLGARKDPFAPARVPAVRASGSTDEETARGDSSSGSGGAVGGRDSSGSGSPAFGGSGGSSGSPSGGSGSGAGGSDVSPIPTPTPGPSTPGDGTGDPPGEEKPSYELYSLTVRFGEAETTEELPERTLKRLEPLPSVEEPSLVYLGVLEDKRTAVFLVDANVAAEGDGECKPAPTSCETIQLREGETEFLDVKDDTGAVVEQYRLDIVKIHRKRTASAAKARRAYASEAKVGRRALQARIAATGPLRVTYDRRRGTLRRRSAKVYAALVGRAEVLEARAK